MTDVDCGRLRDKGVHCDIEECHAERIHQKRLHPHEPPIVAKRRAERGRGAFFCGQCLGQKMDGEKEQDGDHRHEPEDPAPAADPHEERTEERSDDGRRRHDEHECREHGRRLTARIEVAHHRAAEHRSDARTDRLHDAERDDHLHRARECTADRADEEEQRAECERNAPPDTVTDRPPDELGNGKANEKARDRERSRAPEIILQERHRRQVDVRRERSERHECTQNDEKEKTGFCLFHRISFVNR